MQGGQVGGSPAPPSVLGHQVSTPDFEMQDLDMRDLDVWDFGGGLIAEDMWDFGGGLVAEGGWVGIKALLNIGEGDLISMKGAGWVFTSGRSFLCLMGVNVSSTQKARFVGLLCEGGGV